MKSISDGCTEPIRPDESVQLAADVHAATVAAIPAGRYDRGRDETAEFYELTKEQPGAESPGSTRHHRPNAERQVPTYFLLLRKPSDARNCRRPLVDEPRVE